MKKKKKKIGDAQDKVSNTRQSQSKVFTGLYQLLRRGLLIAREGWGAVPTCSKNVLTE